MMRAPITSILAVSTLVLTGQIAEELPLLEYLPNGTSLTNVSIPNYDEERKPTSAFKADEVAIVDKDAGIMEGKNVSVKVFTDPSPYTISLKKARFFYRENYLKADQQISLTNDALTFKGTGAYYDMKTRELFVNGPARALLIPQELSRNLLLGVVSATALLSSEAAPPSVPTQEELRAIEERVKGAPRITSLDTERLSAKIEGLSESLENARIYKSQQISHLEMIQKKKTASDERLNAFLERTAQGDLLIQNKAESPKGEVSADAPVEEKKEEVKEPQGITTDGALKIECEDGMYYDAEEGVMVFLKNVVVTERRFDLKCKEQLKVILTVEEKSDKKGDENEKGDMGFGSTDLKELIASGDVEITYKDTGEGQEPVTLTGETAFFNAETEEVTVNGGIPTMRQGNSLVEALKPTWLKLSRKGVRFGSGTRTVYIPDEKQ